MTAEQYKAQIKTLLEAKAKPANFVGIASLGADGFIDSFETVWKELNGTLKQYEGDEFCAPYTYFKLTEKQFSECCAFWEEVLKLKKEKETLKTCFQFKTGRNYGVDQVLHITIKSAITDEFGFIDFVAEFVDSARGISGEVWSFAKNASEYGTAVLAAYDEGRYTDPRTPAPAEPEPAAEQPAPIQTSLERNASAGEAKVLRKLISEAGRRGHLISVFDGEEWALKRKPAKKLTERAIVYDALASTGEDTIKIRDNAGTLLATFWVIYGNCEDGSEVLSDWSDTPEANDLVSAIKYI